MKRKIDNYLIQWRNDENRKPLVVRGARQVGKTTAVRALSQTFKNYLELDFESMPQLHHAFENDLNPEQIVTNLQIITKKTITAGDTLLFFDEVQVCPRALLSLRYFYEQYPALHVIAAGSLLDFAIDQVGIPVGRVQFLYMTPMSFYEFLTALDEHFLIDAILNHDPNKPIQSSVHEKALRLFGEYLAIGGMPEAVLHWREKKNYSVCLDIHHDLITAYKQDFEKFARKSQIKYVEHLFAQIPFQIGKRFRFSEVTGDFRKRELEPALELLKKANVISMVLETAAQGLPLSAQANPHYFKIMMLDIALTQTLLGLTSEQWIFDPHTAFVNKGAIAECYVGQELLAYSQPRQAAQLHYWQRHERGSEAEVDFVIASQDNIIPVEVKSGAGSTLKSIHLFLKEHPQSPYGIRFSAQNFSIYEKIKSLPLYAVMQRQA